MAVPDRLTFSQGPAEEARERANAWVARFAPLVMDSDALTVPEIRERLALLERLRSEGPEVRKELRLHGTFEDATLGATMDRALEQLDSLESELRRRLGRLAPGDPQGLADLEQLNEALAERQARQEVGIETDVPAVLELRTGAPNYAAAGFAGLFGFGWTSFTAFHAFMMIGGLMKSFGWGALALLGFYAIFFAVGFAMLFGAVAAASTESIVLDGRRLTVRRTFLGWVRERRHELDPGALPSIEALPSSNNRSAPGRALVLADTEGRPIHLAAHATEQQRMDLRERIEAYLQALPAGAS